MILPDTGWRTDDRYSAAAGPVTGSSSPETPADVVRPGEPFQADIKKTVNRIDKSGELVNRIVLKKAGGLVLLGHQRESTTPQCMPDAEVALAPLTEILRSAGQM